MRIMILEDENDIDTILKKLNTSFVADFSNEEKQKENLPKLIRFLSQTVDV